MNHHSLFLGSNLGTATVTFMASGQYFTLSLNLLYKTEISCRIFKNPIQTQDAYDGSVIRAPALLAEC